MLAELKTGLQALADGATAAARISRQGSVVVRGDIGHRARYDGNIFSACNSAAQALSLNSATATGLILSNPIGSGKVLMLLKVRVAIVSLPAGAAPLILTGGQSVTAITHTTPLTVRNTYLANGNTAVGLADSAATIPTPAIISVLGGGPAATVATGTSFPPFIEANYDGEIVLPEGGFISLQCLTTAISVVASMTWAEESA